MLPYCDVTHQTFDLSVFGELVAMSATLCVRLSEADYMHLATSARSCQIGTDSTPCHPR